MMVLFMVFDLSQQPDAAYKVTTKDSCTKIERDGSLIGTVRLLEAECQARGIATEYLCDSIPTWIAHVEKHELKRGFGSHQFWTQGGPGL
jgi:hypothetical protein